MKEYTTTWLMNVLDRSVLILVVLNKFLLLFFLNARYYHLMIKDHLMFYINVNSIYKLNYIDEKIHCNIILFLYIVNTS